MRLTRIVVRVAGKTRHIQGVYRSNAGSRVKLNHGTLQEGESIMTIIDKIEDANRDFRKLRLIGGM